MKDLEKKVMITHLPLDKDKEEVFSLAKRSRLLINSICQYAKDLRRKGIKVYERHVNIIRTEGGYFCAFYEQDLKDNITNFKEKEEQVKPFKGIDGRMKVRLHNQEGEEVVEDLARMVAMAFVPNPDNYEYVKFRDGNIENTKAENLYWSKYK